MATVRPDSWNLPLLLHVAGAKVLVGTLVVVALLLLAASRNGGGPAAGRLGFRTLLIGSLPAYVAMRAGAEWIADKENVPDDATWVGIGYSVADGGLLLLIIATVLAWRSARKDTPSRAAGVVSAILIAAYLVALWAMVAKPV